MDGGLGALVVKRVLMVAFHFPPMNVSSGIQRTLRFAQYLPEFGWEPAVLTAHPRAYTGVSPAGLAEIPPQLLVRRAFALDTGRHLSLRGAYPRALALPDRWSSWCVGAIPAGLALIRKWKPDVLWSTYPIATAHLIGYALHRMTGMPWIADFRDPMTESDYPADLRVRSSYRWIERKTLQHCRQAVFTAPGALRLHAERYPGIPASRLTVIENGYDESSFAGATLAPARPRTEGAPWRLVHSGTIYPSERDPRPFFAALSAMQASGAIRPGELSIVLRATGADDYLRDLIERGGIGGIVKLEPSIPYREALAEMLGADGLLLLQAGNVENQVPAKLYEYLRARRPILALTTHRGDTAAVLRASGIDTIVQIDSEQDIAAGLTRFLELLRLGRAPVATEPTIAAASRRGRTEQFAGLLDAVAGR